MTVKVEMQNSGRHAGEEVVQLYLSHKAIDEVAPRCQLAAFKKVMLQPGERTTVEFTPNPRSLSYVDETGCVAEEPGQVMLYVGNVCPSAPQRFTAGLLSKPIQLKGEAKIFMY